MVNEHLDSPPVRLLQHPGEIAELLKTYRTLKPRYVMEIGSFCGGTLWYWLKYAVPGAKVVSFDLIIQDGQAHEQQKGREQWHEWVRKDVEFSSHLLSTLSTSFPAVLRREFPNGIDYVFIDGGHSYQAVQQDFGVSLQHLRDGGVIALHDIFSEGEGMEVADFWQKVKTSGMKCFEISNPDGTDGGCGRGIGVVMK